MDKRLSYVHGASDALLLGETIGQNLDRTAARFPNRDATSAGIKAFAILMRSFMQPSKRRREDC